MITLDQAREIVAVARAKGREMGLKPLSVTVLDAGGHPLVFEREDGTFGFEEYRRDPEDGQGWFVIGHHGHHSFNSFEAAEEAAKSTVAWF